MVYTVIEAPGDDNVYMAAWKASLGIDDEGNRAWCPGASPPDNSCPPSNKGSGKDAGDKGSGRKKPSGSPPRTPTRREVSLASRPGSTKRQVAARRVVAAHFLHTEGKFFDRQTGELKPLDESRLNGQMKGIDWTKPVQVGPPPRMPPPGEFVQWQAPGNIPPAGGYFSTPGTPPERIGIGRLGTAWSRPGQPVVEKVPHSFSVTGARRYIRSTAAPVNDNWSIQGGQVQQASGGGQQWFVPDAQAGGGIDEFVLRGPRGSSRAFCPTGPGGGVDNSCGRDADEGGIDVSDVSGGSSFEKELHFKADGGIVKVAKSKWSPADWSVIDTFVDEDKRRKGIASKLIAKVKQDLPGSISAQASSDSSVDLFWKHGFRMPGGGSLDDARNRRREDSSVLLIYEPKKGEPENGKRAFCPGVSPPDNSCSPANKGEGSPREQSLAEKHDLTPKQAKWALRMIDDLEKRFSGPGRAAAVNEVLSAAKYPKYLNGILEATPTKGEIEAVITWSVRRGRMWEPDARRLRSLGFASVASRSNSRRPWAMQNSG